MRTTLYCSGKMSHSFIVLCLPLIVATCIFLIHSFVIVLVGMLKTIKTGVFFCFSQICPPVC